MAVTTTYSGGLALNIALNAALGGDRVGSDGISEILSIAFAAAGGTAPTLSGFLKGDLSVTGAQDLLLAHATDPLQSAGDAGYPAGFTVAGTKLKLLYIRNSHATATLTVARKATNGLPIFVAASDGIIIEPGGHLLWYAPAGSVALTTGSNDGITLSPSAGTVTGVLVAAYGP